MAGTEADINKAKKNGSTLRLRSGQAVEPFFIVQNLFLYRPDFNFLSLAAVVKLRFLGSNVLDDFDLLDGRRVHREYPFYPDTGGDTANCKSRVDAAAMLPRDDLALEHLHAVAISRGLAGLLIDDWLFDFLVNPNLLTGAELGQAGFEMSW